MIRPLRLLAVALLLGASLVSSAAGALHEFVVAGRFLYEDKAWDASGWTGANPILPVRHADVSVLDAVTGKLIGRHMTDANGDFAVDCRTSRPVLDVVVRLDSDTRVMAKATKGFPRLTVMSTSKAVYSAFSPVVLDHPSDQTLDVGVTTVLKVSSGAKEGHPFNVFDVALDGLLYVTGPEIGAQPKRVGVRVYWPNVLGSYAIHRQCWISVNDGYDDAVILHEIGHVVHNIWSDSDNPGGVHYFGDSDQDPRLSFGEGYATAFAGMVLEHFGREALYVDSSPTAKIGGYQLRLMLESTAPYTEGALGSADEVAVACVLYDLLDGPESLDGSPGVDDDELTPASSVAGLTPAAAWWKVFSGPVKRAKHLTVNQAWDGWLKVHALDPAYDALREVYDSRKLSFFNDAAEPDNDPTTATPVEILSGVQWIPERTLYYAEDGHGPGKGDQDWYAVELQAGMRVEIETRYPGGIYDATTQADPWLALFDPALERRAVDDDSGFGRNARIADFLVTESGTWTFVVRSRNKVKPYGRYEVRILRVD